MARSLLSAGVPIAFMVLFLAFDSSLGQRSPKIQPSLRAPPPSDNTTQANQPKALYDIFGANAGVGANAGIQGRPAWANGGVNANAGLSNNVIGQAVAGFGSAIGAGVGGVVGSAANLVLSPFAAIRPLFGGWNNGPPPPMPPPQPFYLPQPGPPQGNSPAPPPYYPFSQPAPNSVGMVGWGMYGQNSGTLSYNQCNALWKDAILKEALNYDDWRCSARLLPDNTIQPCVLTGAIGTSVTPAVITTGCGWTMPLFCDDSINDMVYGLRASTPTPTPTTPTGYTYVPGVGTYKVHTEALTWTAAKAACEQEGAHLAVPSTASDYSTIQSLFNSAIAVNNNGGWVGLSDNAIEGYFQTVTGQPACTLGQMLFNAGDPDNGVTAAGPAENCIQFGLAQSAKLNDVVCTATLPFICEITLPARLATCRSSTSG